MGTDNALAKWNLGILRRMIIVRRLVNALGYPIPLHVRAGRTISICLTAGACTEHVHHAGGCSAPGAEPACSAFLDLPLATRYRVVSPRSTVLSPGEKIAMTFAVNDNAASLSPISEHPLTVLPADPCRLESSKIRYCRYRFLYLVGNRRLPIQAGSLG